MTHRKALVRLNFGTAAFLLAAAMILGGVACDKEGSTASENAVTHEGQGEALAADPVFDIKFKIEGGAPAGEASAAATAGGEFATTARMFAVYQAKPPKEGETERAQGFELSGEDFVIAGNLPKELKLAPGRKFDQLIGQPVTIRSRGGDPTMIRMSKIKVDEGGKVYLVNSGTLTVEKVFHRKGQYAGVSGRFEMEVQQIQEGNTDDPNNKGDQPIGSPVRATGTFTSRADSFAYEQL
jgi:hypothetical protein